MDVWIYKLLEKCLVLNYCLPISTNLSYKQITYSVLPEENMYDMYSFNCQTTDIQYQTSYLAEIFSTAYYVHKYIVIVKL